MHPIWSVEHQDWVELGQLEVGDHLLTNDGPVEVLSTRLFTTGKSVYNLEVHGHHIYQVIELGIWVHNAGISKYDAPGRGGPYGHIDDHPSVNTGKPFTPNQKKKILAENEATNGGRILDDVTGEPLVRPQQHRHGVTPPDNEAHIDHVYPRSEGGPNTSSNAEVRARIHNLKKGNKVE